MPNVHFCSLSPPDEMRPSYFFHLKLELYPTPAVSKKRRVSTTTDIYLPRAGSDIFRTPLPAHRTARWPKVTPATQGTPKRSPASSESPRSPRQLPIANDHPESHGEALLLPERNLKLREAVPPSPALAPIKPTNEDSALDWRYEAVSIESIDMEAQASASVGGKSVKGAVNGGLHTKALYLPSDPKTTDVGYGVVHLYRDAEEAAQLGKEESLLRKSLDRARPTRQDENFDPDDCTTLCILAVPSWMMPSDLLGFVGDQAREDVSHFRLIRTGRANKYMVLMKFRQARRARDWQKAYNGRLFSAAEPENCHVVFIKSVEFLLPEDEPSETFDDATNFPQNTNDPFTPYKVTGGRQQSTSQSLTSKPFAPPPPNLLELPTCPVCLERMDETTGLLTILCQHVFHCACLEKWRGSGCPVCRYTHSPSYTFPYPRPSQHDAEDHAEPTCAVCTSTSNLWICLICGSIGCGRYDDAHAFAHYEATSHCYAMDISTQHVWDYAGDGYVHRLIQSKPDSKLIDLPHRERHENEAFRAEGGDSVPREKMESMATEYTYLLTSQLEGQRRYFEEQVERAVDKASQASSRAEEAAAHAQRAVSELDDAKQERESLSAMLARVEASLAKSEKAKGRFEQMARDLSASLREEKLMSEGLMKRITAAEGQAADAKAETAKAKEEKRELEDMNHDLTMFISSQEKVKELQAQGEEVVDGSASVPEQSGKKKGKGKKK